MNKPQRILNRFRIAPHGIVPPILATAFLMDRALGLGLHERIPYDFGVIVDGVVAGLGISCLYFNSRGNKLYNRFREFIENHGLDKRHVEPNLMHYCDRQAYKAAAFSCGYAQKFDRINREYKGPKFLAWIPEV